MSYIVKLAEEKEALEIAQWEYEEPYSMYNIGSSQESINELLDGPYYVIQNYEGIIFGYFCIGENAQVPGGNEYSVYSEINTVDLGLGMNPDFTGQGKGTDFLGIILEYMKEKFPTNKIRLTVLYYNKRAIKTYMKSGFEKKGTFNIKRGTRVLQFMIMTKTIDEGV